MQRAWSIALIAALIAAFVGACTQTWKPADTHADTSVFDHPWVWLDDRGGHVAFAQWRGTPVVLVAIFTTCQETCPRTLGKLREVYDQFGRDHRHAEFVVVTIDPETDTPERLREFRKSRNLPEAWHLLTGGSQETQQLADLLGVHIMAMDTGMDPTHVVHDSKIMLFDANGRTTSELEIQ
jgi:protein SCO1